MTIGEVADNDYCRVDMYANISVHYIIASLPSSSLVRDNDTLLKLKATTVGELHLMLVAQAITPPRGVTRVR
jgi:hypothetical protein